MNIEKILEYAKFFDTLPEEQFDMQEACGAACCIGGWVRKIENSTRAIMFAVKYTFEITSEIADEICYPNDPHCDYTCDAYAASPQQAAVMLRNLAGTGRVDWERAMNEAPGQENFK